VLEKTLESPLHCKEIKKLKIAQYHDPAIPLMGIYSKETKILI